jgi:hypothetical protein
MVRKYMFFRAASLLHFSGVTPVYIKNGKIFNNQFTAEDYLKAEAIYGTDLGVIKGKITSRKPNHVQIDFSLASYEKDNIILAVDVMYFTGLYFLVTVSRTIGFIIVMHRVNRK